MPELKRMDTVQRVGLGEHRGMICSAKTKAGNHLVLWCEGCNLEDVAATELELAKDKLVIDAGRVRNETIEEAGLRLGTDALASAGATT